MLLRRIAMILILLIAGALSLTTTNARVATAQQAPLRVLPLYHPNHRNFCADIEFKTFTPTTIPDASHRTRTCKELTVILDHVGVTMHCPGNQPMQWWGFYPDKPINHGFISIDHFKALVNHSGHVDGLVANVISSAAHHITFWIWIDCGPH